MSVKVNQNVKYYVVCRSLLDTRSNDINTEIKELFEATILPDRKELRNWINFKQLTTYNEDNLFANKKLQFTFHKEDNTNDILRMKFYALCRYQLKADMDEISDDLITLFKDEAPSLKVLHHWIETCWHVNQESKIDLIKEKEQAVLHATNMQTKYNNLEILFIEEKDKLIKRQSQLIKEQTELDQINENKINLLTTKVSNLEKELDNGTKLHFKHSLELLKMSEDLKNSLNEIQKITQQNEHYKQRLNQMNSESNTIEPFKEQMKKAEEMLSELSHKYDEQKVELMNRNLKIKDLEDQIVMHIDTVNKLEISNKQSNDLNAAITIEKNSLEDRVNALLDSNDSLIQSDQHAKRLISQLEETNAQLNQSLTQQTDLNQGLESRIDLLQSKLIDSQQKNDSLLKSKAEFIPLLANKDDIYSKIINGLKQEVEFYSQVEKQCKTELDFYKHETTETINELKTKLNKTSLDLDQLQLEHTKTVESKEQLFQSTQITLSQFETNVQSLNLDKKFLEEEIDELKQSNREYSITNSNLNETISNVTIENNQFKSQIEQLFETINELKKKNQEQLNDFNKNLLLINEKEAINSNQLTVIANLNDNICHLNTDYSSLKQKNESLNNQMKQILELKEQREQKLVEALTEQSLQQLLMNIETQDSNESIKRLEDLVNELNSKLEIDKIESLKQIELKKDEINLIKTNNDSLKQQLKSLNLEKKYLEEQITQLQKSNYNYSIRNSKLNDLINKSLINAVKTDQSTETEIPSQDEAEFKSETLEAAVPQEDTVELQTERCLNDLVSIIVVQERLDSLSKRNKRKLDTKRANNSIFEVKVEDHLSEYSNHYEDSYLKRFKTQE